MTGKTKMKKIEEITPRLVIRESDVRDIELVKKYFKPILRVVFGTAYIEIIKNDRT